ncbi:MAG: restriction endonuclease subunit S [Bacteroidetes bacterium]|nr:restriction endonuclease subunit S [Bacteroidota bacterium]
MARETSSTIFRGLVNSPLGIIAEFIINSLAKEIPYEPLRNYFAEIQTGKTPPMSNPDYYSSDDMEWIKPSDIGFEKYITGSHFISNKAIKENKATIYKPNTILIICIGGGIGRLGIVDKACSSNQQITGVLFNNKVIAEFAYYFFLSRYKIFEANSSKSTLPIINQKGLGNLDFICPNLDLQIEIVRFLEYVKECFLIETHPKFDKFNIGIEIINFAEKAFKAYYTQKDLLEEYQFQLTQLENLNQAILQEAVQGKLVAHDKKDEPASELLKRIKAEKAKLGKKEKPLPTIKTEEIPFEIPESWVWCRLGDAVDSVADVDHRMPEKKNIGIPYISPRDFYGLNEIDFEGAKKISDEDYNSLSRKVKPEKFDIIFPRYGTIGVCRFLDYEKIFLASYSCVTIKTNKTNTDPKYIFYYCICPFSKIEIDRHTVKTTQPNVGIKSILEFRFPIPPLSEQKRIVAEIEKQLAKTKQLKAHIIANQQATEQLLKALLHQAFEVEESEKQTVEIVTSSKISGIEIKVKDKKKSKAVS